MEIYFATYIQSEWVDFENEETIADQVMKHVNDMTASISEGDLVNSTELVTDRIFIMTVYKGKGLEFENVVILWKTRARVTPRADKALTPDIFYD